MIKSLFSSVDESDAVEVHPIGSSSISFSIHFFGSRTFFAMGKSDNGSIGSDKANQWMSNDSILIQNPKLLLTHFLLLIPTNFQFPSSFYFFLQKYKDFLF